jgi:hypothetical protein
MVVNRLQKYEHIRFLVILRDFYSENKNLSQVYIYITKKNKKQKMLKKKRYYVIICHLFFQLT